MNSKIIFSFMVILASTIIGGDVASEVEIESIFLVYQAAVRHILLAWQRVEQGIVEENQIIEVIGRLVLVQYFFEHAEESVKKAIRHDARFWIHVTDHILIHFYQASIASEMAPFLQKTIDYIQQQCVVHN